MFFSRKKSKKAPEFEPAPDVSEMIKKLASHEEFDYIDAENVYCIRSQHSQARAYARIWGLSRIFQVAAGWKPTYVIEVLAHHYDKLPEQEKLKVLIHELMHIPKTFSGALRPHKGRYHKINKSTVDKLYKQLIQIGFVLLIGVGVLFGRQMAASFGAAINFPPATYAQSDFETGIEHISNYDVDAKIYTSGKITVKENIEYDFGQNEKHGIIREIPYVKVNKDGKRYAMMIDVNSVLDQEENPYMYRAYKEGEKIIVKIGDPNRTISGKHTYVISYVVSGALTYFSDHDELYWNAIGTGWQIPIQSAQTHLQLPSGISAEAKTSFKCYAGPDGSTDESRCTINKNGADVIFSVNSPLFSGEGVTIVAGWPKNIVSELNPVPVVNFFDTLLGKLILGSVLVLALWWYLYLPLSIAFKWYMHGRDPYVGIPPTAYYDPPKTESGREVSPAEAGALIDEKADLRDVMAMLVDLARRGYYMIDERAKNELWLVRKDQKKKDVLTPVESKLLTALFSPSGGSAGDEVKVKDLKLASDITKIQNMMYEELVSDGFFLKNPQTTRLLYQGLAALAFVTGNIPLIFSALIFGQNMPRKTLLGAQEAQKTKGLLAFLKSQERQLKFQADKQLMFEKLLPFAIAFGVERVWVNRFKDINLQNPEWYHTYRGNTWDSAVFSHSLHSSMSQLTTSATPVTSSSGFSSGFSGGSSGGGGGGGGGGSW